MKVENPAYSTLVLVPDAWLKEVMENLRILVSRTDPNTQITRKDLLLEEWINETDARTLLGRKATWFWKKRKASELSYTKVGRKVVYSLTDIKLLLERNKR